MTTEFIPTRKELIAHVKAYAMARYEKQGWDYVVEALTDEEINQLIGPLTRTTTGAVRQVWEKFVQPHHSQHLEIVNA